MIPTFTIVNFLVMLGSNLSKSSPFIYLIYFLGGGVFIVYIEI